MGSGNHAMSPYTNEVRRLFPAHSSDTEAERAWDPLPPVNRTARTAYDPPSLIRTCQDRSWWWEERRSFPGSDDARAVCMTLVTDEAANPFNAFYVRDPATTVYGVRVPANPSGLGTGHRTVCTYCTSRRSRVSSDSAQAW